MILLVGFQVLPKDRVDGLTVCWLCAVFPSGWCVTKQAFVSRVLVGLFLVCLFVWCCFGWLFGWLGFSSMPLSAAGIIFHVCFGFDVGCIFKRANKQSLFQRKVNRCVPQLQDQQLDILACWAQYPLWVGAFSFLLTGCSGCVCLEPTPWVFWTDALSCKFFPSTTFPLHYWRTAVVFWVWLAIVFILRAEQPTSKVDASSTGRLIQQWYLTDIKIIDAINYRQK